MRRAMEESIAYALERKTFGVPIAEHQMVQALVAEMGIKYEATRLLVHKAAWQVDQGKMDPKLTAMAKYWGGRIAVEVCDEAIQLLGGYGYVTEFEVERFYRDSKIIEIYEGTKEIQKNTIASYIIGKI